MESSENPIKEIKELVDVTSFIDENDIPYVIEKLSSLNVDPNTISPSLLDVESADCDNLSDESKDKEIKGKYLDEDGVDDEKIIDFAENEKGRQAFQLYLRDVAEITKRYKPLTREEEISLAKKVREEHSQAAKEKIINSNLRLVIHNAKKFKNRGVSIEDLVQEGNIGLCIAVDKYNYKKNFRFSTYATWWILQRIKKAIMMKDGIIKVPAHILYKAKTLSSVRDAFIEENGRAPTKRELSDLTGMSPRTIQTVLNIPQCKISLDAPIDCDNETMLGDIVENSEEISVEDLADMDVLRKKVAKGLEVLDQREKYIIVEYFYKRRSLQSIGESLGGLSRERIRQLRNEAMQKLTFSPDILNYIN